MYYEYPATDSAHETPHSDELWRQYVKDHGEAKALPSS